MKNNFYKLLWVCGFVAAIVIPTLVRAQQAPAPTEFKLTVTNDDVNTIGKALGRLPFDDVAQLIQKLREQIVSQSKPPEVPVVVPPVVPK